VASVEVAVAAAAVAVAAAVADLNAADPTNRASHPRYRSLWRACRCRPKSLNWFSISHLSDKLRNGVRLRRGTLNLRVDKC
jgi:hypothetical protein